MNCFRYTKTLNDYFPGAILGNGLFTAISKEHWYPDISPAAFDTYFCLTAGEKLGAKVLEKFTDDEGEFVFGPLCPNRDYEIQLFANKVKHCKICTEVKKEGKCLKGVKLNCMPMHKPDYMPGIEPRSSEDTDNSCSEED